MFEKPDIEDLSNIVNGNVFPPEFWKLNEEKTDLVPKSEEEILADDFNSSIERRAEYKDYLNYKIELMEKYLSDTDWYVTRKVETDKPIPQDVSVTRENYRELISYYRNKLKLVDDN